MTVSVCMIVRNEEEIVPDFLAHAAGIADQMVVLDTGSTDRTPSLFQDAGAEVHTFSWQDDFAMARNESLRHATGDWILVLDADEFPDPGFTAEVTELTRRDDVGAATIERTNEQRNGIDRSAPLLRMFRNDPEIRYRYRIHEDASESVAAMLRRTGRSLAHLRTPVRHVGYRPNVIAARNKEARDERLLRLALEDDPKDLYSRYKLLELYRFHNRPEDMPPIARDCLALIRGGTPIQPPYLAGDLIDMIRAALMPQDGDGLALLEELKPLGCHSGHYHLSVAMLLERMGRMEGAAAGFRRALSHASDDPAWRLIVTRAAMGLTRLRLTSGDIVGARREIAMARRISPEDPEVALASRYLNLPQV